MALTYSIAKRICKALANKIAEELPMFVIDGLNIDDADRSGMYTSTYLRAGDDPNKPKEEITIQFWNTVNDEDAHDEENLPVDDDKIYLNIGYHPNEKDMEVDYTDPNVYDKVIEFIRTNSSI